MSIKVAPQQNYQKVVSAYPDYKYVKVPTVNPVGQNNTLINTSGGTDVRFDLPVLAYNLAQSSLQFTIKTAASTHYSFLFMDALSPFSQIQLFTRGGAMLCDLQNVQNFTKVIWKSRISRKEYENMDTHSMNETVGTGSGNFLRMNKNPTVGGTVQNIYAKRPTETNDLAILENSYLEHTEDTKAGVMFFSIPLSLLRDTILSLDKTVWMGEILTLRLVIGQKVKVGFKSDDLTPSATAVLADSSIQDFALYLATERNQNTVNLLREKALSPEGIQYNIPFVWTFTNPLTGTQQNTSVRLSKAQGQKLLRIYHSIFNTETGLNAYNNSQVASNLDSFYTSLNSQRLQDWNLNVNNYDDWMQMKKHLSNSITYSANIYYYSHYWIDDFCGLKSFADDDDLDSNEIKGVDLGEEIRYDFVSTMSSSTANTHYDFAVVSRIVSVSPQGIMIL